MTIKTGHLYTNKSTNSTVETSIDFEKDQQDAMKKTEGIQSLADQVERLEGLLSRIEISENNLKDLKKEQQRISGEVIPTMMSEMGLSELKLQDGSHLKVSTSYKAHITEANKEAAYNWLQKIEAKKNPAEAGSFLRSWILFFGDGFCEKNIIRLHHYFIAFRLIFDGQLGNHIQKPDHSRVADLRRQYRIGFGGGARFGRHILRG